MWHKFYTNFNWNFKYHWIDFFCWYQINMYLKHFFIRTKRKIFYFQTWVTSSICLGETFLTLIRHNRSLNVFTLYLFTHDLTFVWNLLLLNFTYKYVVLYIYFPIYFEVWRVLEQAYIQVPEVNWNRLKWCWLYTKTPLLQSYKHIKKLCFAH